MTHTVAISEVDRGDLQGAYNRLTAYLNATPATLERCLTAPAAGSVLAQEMSDAPAFAATSTAGMYLTVAIEHFGLVHQGLSADRRAGLALITVLRGALEGSVRAAWLVDPSLNTRQRIERGLLERCANVDSLQKVKPDPVHLASRNADIRAVAATHAISLEGHLYRSPLPSKVGGHGRPGVTQLAKDALAALDGSGPDGSDDANKEDGGWFFAWLSAVAHAAGWSLMSERSGETDTDGNTLVRIAGNAKHLAGAIDLVRQVHWLAVERLAALAGLPPGERGGPIQTD